MKIYIVTHKKVNKYGDDHYQLLHVGANLTQTRFGNDYIVDSSGENISDRNKTFCELTGVYWIWKNTNDDIVGLEHYRRYLVEPNEKNLPVCNSTVEQLLLEYDIILPTISKQPNSIKYGWSLTHHIKDMDVLREVISDKYPDYLLEFDSVLSSHQLYICNIMICKKKLYNQYCEWLFDILFEVEKRVDISTYDDMQKRLFGFLSERLLNVWVKHNQLKIKELDMINTETKKTTIITSKLYYIARYIFHIDILYFQVHRKLRIYRGE